MYKKINIRYVIITNPNDIFGMVGRCGGGYNTIWEDWSPEGRIARDNINREFEEGMNEICGHYDRLEKSMLEEGFRNPIIITAGPPLIRPIKLLPPELRSPHVYSNLLLAEGTTGGSRLYVAQKHNIPVPCLVNDRVNRFRKYPHLTLDQAIQCYKDKPRLTIGYRGVLTEVLHTVPQYHLEEQWKSELSIRYKRARLWINVMEKYGYHARLPGTLLQELLAEEARVVGINTQQFDKMSGYQQAHT